MKTRTLYLSAICLLVMSTGVATVSGQVISGVFGLAPVADGAALAVWVPLESGEAVSGVKWYNNDGSKVFPKMLAVAGEVTHPSALDNAVLVGEDIAGSTLGWSEVTFQPALASATPGLFLIFKLPDNGSFVSEGEGCGLGYQLGDGEIRCWVSTTAGEWSQLSPEYQMAVEAIMNTNKSGDVLVLGTKDQKPQSGEKPPVPTVAAMRVSPNPFNPRTTINYSLPKDSNVTLTVYDVRGREVINLVSGYQTAGAYKVSWDGHDGLGTPQPSGVYLAQIHAGPICLTRRMTLVQ